MKKSNAYLKIAVNEAFTPVNAIKKLTSELPLDTPNCAVYFNFTMLPPGVRSKSEVWTLELWYFSNLILRPMCVRDLDSEILVV